MARVEGLKHVFSPNGDRFKDINRFLVELRERAEIRVDVVDASGDAVRRLADDAVVSPARPLQLGWNGRTDEGRIVPDGRYRVRVTLRREGRSVTVPRTTLVDTHPPRPRVRADQARSDHRPRGRAGPDRGRLGLAPPEQAREGLPDRRRRAARRGGAAARDRHPHADMERPGGRQAGAARHVPGAGVDARPRRQRGRHARARPAWTRRRARPSDAGGAHDRRRAARAPGHGREAGEDQRRRPRPPVPLAAAAPRRDEADQAGQGQGPPAGPARPPRRATQGCTCSSSPPASTRPPSRCSCSRRLARRCSSSCP